jgi:putative acetyltransferase
MISIRLARDEDLAKIARLHRQTIRHVNAQDYHQEQITVWAARSKVQRFRGNAARCKRWVAVEGEKIIGFVDHGFECELWGLYMHKDYIGKGIGSRLLKRAEASLKKHGCRKIMLQSTITAKNFYLCHGYKLVRKDLHPMGNQKLPIFIMSKKIS